MTNEEINRYIHVEIRGLCWHECRRRTFEEREPQYGWFGSIKDFKFSAIDDKCIHCGIKIQPINVNSVDKVLENYKNDYCSDDRPRSLLYEVLDKHMRDAKLWRKCLDWLTKFTSGGPFYKDDLSIDNTAFSLMFATAEHISRSCVYAHKNK